LKISRPSIPATKEAAVLWIIVSHLLIGRTLFLARTITEPTGLDQRKETAAFGCPLILAQLLGYMKKEQVTHGVFITSGRAHYAWIEVPVSDDAGSDGDNEPEKKKAKPNSVVEHSESSSPTIMLTYAVMITHPNFLRMMASFLRQGQASSIEEKVRASELLSLPSADGGFTRGKAQDISKSAKEPKTTKSGTKFRDPVLDCTIYEDASVEA
jgi:hypothetical protein